MVASLQPYLAPTWETGLVLIQIGVCITMWRLLRRQERMRREEEFRLQLLINNLQAERKAKRARRMLAHPATLERPARSLH